MSWLANIFDNEDRREKIPLSDSVNCRFSVTVLLMLCVVTAFPQLIQDEPIECNPANNITYQLAKYANKVGCK